MTRYEECFKKPVCISLFLLSPRKSAEEESTVRIREESDSSVVDPETEGRTIDMTVGIL